MKSLWLLVVGLAAVTAQAQSNEAQSQEAKTNPVPAQVTAPATVVPEPSTGTNAPVPAWLNPAAVEPGQPDALEPADQGLQAHITKPMSQTIFLSTGEKPNEIMGKRFKFSGVFVQAVKTDNLLQLFNPLAPVEYGEADDNLLHDPISNAPAGIKVFSIQF